MKTKTMVLNLAIVGAGLFLAGCTESSAQKTLNSTVVDIEVEAVKEIGWHEGISYSGTIEESESIALSFPVVGQVSRVLVSDGDEIHEGQLLAELDDRSYRNTYEIALATLAQAEDAHERLMPMYKNGSLPEIKYVEIQTGLLKAKAAVAIARKTLDDCRLISPVNGLVGRRSMEPGMSALPNLVSIDIVKIEKVYAKVAIAENDISSIDKGQNAIVKIGALGHEEHEGIVEHVGVVANPISRTYKIKIGLENLNRRIKPGMICQVALERTDHQARLSVPSRAVLIDELGNNYAYVVKNNKAVKKHIETGKLLKNGIEVTAGLQVGEYIVVAGQQKLVNHSLVRVVNQQER